MLFKKEFDIDKDFFLEEDKGTPKRKVALRVFLFVLFLTFGLLCISAFTFNFNSRFGHNGEKKQGASLKEAKGYFYDAVRYYENGDFTKATEALNKQLSIVDDPDSYNYLAKIYLEKGQVEFAIANFKKALELDPDFFEANFELGKIYFSLNNFKAASPYLTRASSAKIDNLEALSLTAQTYKMTGKSDDAVVIFKKILEFEPENILANAKIGEIYFQRQKYKEAIGYLEDAIQASFEENVALQLAKCYLELGSLQTALDIANEILTENPDNIQANSLKTSLEYKLGKMKKNTTTNEIQRPKETKHLAPIDPDILNKYIAEIEKPIKMNWTPPVGSNLKKASVKFTVNKDGELVSNLLYLSSGMVDFDKSALDAIELSAPYPPLPLAMDRETLDIIFTFDFNIK